MITIIIFIEIPNMIDQELEIPDIDNCLRLKIKVQDNTIAKSNIRVINSGVTVLELFAIIGIILRIRRTLNLSNQN